MAAVLGGNTGGAATSAAVVSTKPPLRKSSESAPLLDKAAAPPVRLQQPTLVAHFLIPPLLLHMKAADILSAHFVRSDCASSNFPRPFFRRGSTILLRFHPCATCSQKKSFAHAVFVFALLCGFFGLNILLNLYNKHVFKQYEFDFPVMIIMWHQLVAYVVLSVLTSTKWFLDKAGFDEEGVKKLNWSWDLDKMGPIVLISILFSINTTSNNASLIYTTLSLNQIVKACTPICTLLFSIPIENKSYPWPTYVTTTAIVAGVFLVAWANPGFEIHGFLLVMYSLITAGLQISLIAKVLKNKASGVVHFSLATALPTVLFGLPFFFLLEAKDFYDYITLTPGEVAVAGHDILHAFFYLTIGAVMALFYNLTRWAVVQHTSSLFLAMVGNFKIGALVALSSVLFDEQLTTTNQVGVALTVVAFMAHTYMQKSERFKSKESAPKLELPTAESKAGEAAREKAIKIAAFTAVGFLVVGYVVVLLWSLLLHPVVHDVPKPSAAQPANFHGPV
eukprot:SAG31_NODE_191_length_20809_cov_64.613761_2_plen_506_part_00